MSWYGLVWQEYSWDDVGQVESRTVQRWHCTGAVAFIAAVSDWFTHRRKRYRPTWENQKGRQLPFDLFLFFTLLNGCPLTAKKKRGENQKGTQRKLCMGNKYGHESQSLWAGKARAPHSLSSPSTGWTIQQISLFMYQSPPAKWNGIHSLFWKVFWDLLVKKPQTSPNKQPPKKMNSPSCKVNFFIWVSWE